VRARSVLMASGIRGGNANHDRKATKKPTACQQNKLSEIGFPVKIRLTPAKVETSRIRVIQVEDR
jgi:hypothetical protein